MVFVSSYFYHTQSFWQRFLWAIFWMSNNLKHLSNRKDFQTISEIRDRVDAEIVHFYTNKRQKMHHQNFNASQDTRCWLEELTPLTLHLEWILLFAWHVKISNKAHSHRGCHIGFNYIKGPETNYTFGKHKWAPAMFVRHSSWLSAHLHVPVIWQRTMNRKQDIISF